MFIFLWHAFDNESIQNAKDLKSQSRPCECMKRRLKVQWNWWNDAPVTVWRRLTMTKVINERNENPFQWNQLYQSARFRLCLIVIANFNPIYLGTTSAKIQFFCFLLIELIFQRKTFETTEIRFMNELHPDYLYWTDCIRLNLSFWGIFPLEQYKICMLDEINWGIHFRKVDSYRYYQFIGIEFDVFIGKLSVNLRFNNDFDWFRYRNEILCDSLSGRKILELMESTIFDYNLRLECAKRLKYE